MEKRKNFRSLIAFVLFTIVMVNLLSEATKATEVTAVNSLKGFYQEEKDSLDLVVIGASEVYTSFSPIQAWKEQGFTSYDYSAPGISGNLCKYMLAEVLRYQKPKVIVFEINGFTKDDKYFYREGNVHNVVDNLRWSENRINAIRNVVPKKDRMSYYFPIQTYHSVWENKWLMLANIGIKLGYQITRTCNAKGMTTQSRVEPMSERKIKGKNYFTKTGRAYLEDLLAYCKEQGLEHVLFYRAPHGIMKKHDERIEKMEKVIRSYGYDFLDCENWIAEQGISLQTDFYNSEHMNIYGAEKFTHAFAAYIKEKYDLPGREDHEKKLIDSWDQSARETDKLMEQCKEDMKNNIKRRYQEFVRTLLPLRVMSITK